MKLFDKVKVLNDKKYYNENNVYKGMIGTIIDAEIRHNSFHVIFTDERSQYEEFTNNEENLFKLKEDVLCYIEIEDLEVFEESAVSDDYIMQNLPEQYPNYWCKVENGYILNLQGEKKNKVPYDFNS